LSFFRRRGLPRSKGPLPTRYVFLLTFVFFLFSTAGGLYVINRGIEPTLMNYAETQTQKIASLVINKAISEKIANGINMNEIIEFSSTDSNSDLTAPVKFNAEIINRVNAEIVSTVLMNLKAAEKGELSLIEETTGVEIEKDGMESEGIVFYVPLGQATNNALLGNLGPKIPVKFNAIGNVHSDVRKKVTPFGINNAYVDITIHIEVTVQIIIPFATQVHTVTQDIPAGMIVIRGQVPEFYNSGGNSDPSIGLPSSKKK
jgi:sporulation protein YunB